jgi:rSAM/selenodomain-associated transferase 1
MIDASATLAVMARYPERGRVKTRLAATVGVELATALYQAFILDLHDRFGGGPLQLVWMYEPSDAPFAALLSAGSICRPQRGADLAERMRNCFETLLTGTGGRDRVIMIGADVPHIDASRIEEAARRLHDCDVVLGPSDDGGYYLIGLRQPHDLFSGIEMGTARVYRQTLDAAHAAGLAVHVLPADFDVDDEADLERLRLRLAAAEAPSLPHTSVVLREGFAR